MDGKPYRKSAELYYHQKGIFLEFNDGNGDPKKQTVSEAWIFFSRFFDKGSEKYFDPFPDQLNPAVNGDWKIERVKEKLSDLSFSPDKSALAWKEMRSVFDSVLDLVNERHIGSFKDRKNAERINENTNLEWMSRTAECAKTTYGGISVAYDDTTHFVEHIHLSNRPPRLATKKTPFVFIGIQEASTGKIFSIQRRDYSKTYLVKLDEEIPDKQYPGYKILKFEEKFQKQLDPTIKGPDDNHLEEKVDVSELTIQKEGETPVIMVKGK